MVVASRTKPLPMLHLEFWVSSRNDRAPLRKAIHGAYQSAKRITEEGRGSGPWVFLVDIDPPDAKSARLRNLLGLGIDEDLWAEFVFYPDRPSMRRIIKRVWKDERFLTHSSRLEKLVSKRLPGYDGLVAYASLQRV